MRLLREFGWWVAGSVWALVGVAAFLLVSGAVVFGVVRLLTALGL
jgi:hypothetical protein